MLDPVWYKSLYWRIAFGFVAMLAALLLAQSLVIVWLTDRVVGWSAQSPEELVSSVAAEMSTALTGNPNLPLDTHVKDQFSHIYRPFAVVMVDGRAASNRPNGLPPGYVRVLQQRLRRGEPLNSVDPRDGGRGGRGGRDRGLDRWREPGALESGRSGGDSGPPDPARGGRGRPSRDGEPGGEPGRPFDGGPGDGPGGPRGSASAPIVLKAASTPIGFVVIPINPPPVFVAIRELGPTLTWVGLVLLAIGAASAALLIFSPAHRRLRTLEQAARALGEGRTDVRAVEAGGDEVSALAKTFNRMADDLGARASALAASDRARRQLLADVSHELMTPLAAVRGYTETLAMPELSLDQPTRSRYLEIIGDETQKLESLIGDLLDLARLEGGGGTLTIEDVPVKELFGRIADRHGPAIRERRITLEVIVQPPDLAVRADGQRLEQALQNLAANALRHTPDGGRVTLAAEAVAEAARITVRDSGPGIPPEHLPHIFERFYKADAARSATRMSGSGLGLSIVQAIVERHGGTVTASNSPDGGACFEIRIPRSDRPTSD
jgi:two-component system sensor histidine kinase BaeS